MLPHAVFIPFLGQCLDVGLQRNARLRCRHAVAVKNEFAPRPVVIEKRSRLVPTKFLGQQGFVMGKIVGHSPGYQPPLLAGLVLGTTPWPCDVLDSVFVPASFGFKASSLDFVP